MHIVLSIAKQRRAALVIILLLLQDHNIMMMSNSCLLLFSHTYKAIEKAKDDTMTMSSLFSSQFFIYFLKYNDGTVVISSRQQNKKREGEGSLPSGSHFCHHLEATLAFALLLPPR